MAKTKARKRPQNRTRAQTKLAPPKVAPQPSTRTFFFIGVAVVALVIAVVVATRQTSDKPAASVAGSTALVGADFHSLAADPAVPGRLFAGGHTAVSESTDNGRTWQRVASLDNADAMGWGFSADTIYMSGHPGIQRSTDRGATFQAFNDALPDTDVHAFGASATRLYAAGPRNGVLVSTDGGRHWTTRTQSAGRAFFGRILVGPDNDDHLVAADVQNGVVGSTDGGRTWSTLGGPPSPTWVSRAGDTLFASGPQGAGRTADGGATWSRLPLPDGATLVEADPSNPAVLYTGALSGDHVRVWVSHDSGAHWARPVAAPRLAAAYQTAFDGLCEARAQASTPDVARAAFFDRVHQRLHELASATAERDRAAAARLLEAKEAVESDLNDSRPSLAADLDQLITASRTAIVATGASAPTPCKEQP